MPKRRPKNPGYGGGPNKGGGDWKPDWKPDGKGDGKGKGGGKRKPKGGGKPEGYKDARRDVMLSVKPLRREIRRVRKQGTRDANQQMERTGNIYEALGNQLAPLGQQYNQQSAGIASGLQGQLSGLAGMLGSSVEGVPQSEIGAGAGMFGALGGGALSELASQQQRNAGYNTSTQSQGAVEGAIGQRNILQDLADFKQDLGQQRIDLMKDVPALIRQRMDEERDINFQKMLALRDMDLRELIANRDWRQGNRALNQSGTSNDALTQLAIAQAQDLLRKMKGGK